MPARYVPARTNPRLTQPLLYGTEEEFGIEYPEGYQAPEPGEDDQVLARMKEREEQRRSRLREELERPKYFPDIMREAGDREEVRKAAIRDLPGQKDPYLRNVHRDTRILFDQRIDGLRQYVFKGLPRGRKLTAEQEQHFSNQAKILYQMCYQEARKNIMDAKDALGNMMSRFDRMTEERKSELRFREKQRVEAAKPGFYEKETFKAGLKGMAEEKKEAERLPKLEQELELREKVKGKYAKGPTFDALLGKLQGLRKKRADYEARVTQMGFEYKATPSVEKARKMIDDSISKTESLMKKRYPDLWKDYKADKKKLDAPTARKYLKRANGDKEKAREMARNDGYEF